MKTINKYIAKLRQEITGQSAKGKSITIFKLGQEIELSEPEFETIMRHDKVTLYSELYDQRWVQLRIDDLQWIKEESYELKNSYYKLNSPEHAS